jgi:lia operon protein LiaF
MKKGNLTGILFILIGLIFLLNNLDYIKISLIDLVRVYWPVILIWLGIDRLIRN